MKVISRLCAALLFCLAAQPAHAATVEQARQFVNTLTPVVMQTLNDTAMSDAQKQKELQQLFVRHVDIDWMGRFVLGAAWQQTTPDQRQRFMAAYRDYLLAHYTTNFADYSGSKYEISSITPDNDGFKVNMEVDTPEAAEEVALGYRLHPGESGQLKISDIIVEGVSLITSQRTEYASVVQQKGMDGLINALQSKSQAAKK